MRKLLFLLFLFPFSITIHAQSALQIQGKAYDVFSSDPDNFPGILTAPQFAPFPSQIISFERHFEDRSFSYIYDIAAKSLTEVRTITPKAGIKISLEDSLRFQNIYSEALSWRPGLDAQERQWFAFVSNGAFDNADIYLGFAGGTTYIRLTIDEAADRTPHWSPDGNAIAFVSRRTGVKDIFLIEEVNKIISDENRNPDNFKLRQLTHSPAEETDLNWNPNPKAFLIAFSQKVTFPGREVPTFQIKVLDVLRNENNIYDVTDDPLANFTRPLWDPQTGGKLLFAGKGLLEDETANLYLSELEWNEDGQLKNRDLEGYKTEIFHNAYLIGTPALWLAGGEAILCQKNLPEQNYPIYSVNITRRLENKEHSVYYFEKLHSEYPYILEYAARKNNFMFINQESNAFKVYLAQIYGDDIIPYKLPEYTLNYPASRGVAVTEVSTEPEFVEPVSTETPEIEQVPGKSNTIKYILAGGAVAAGVATYFLVANSNNGNVTTKGVIIGLPPSLP